MMINEIISNLSSSLGFDIQADFSYSLFNFLDIGGTIRIPMVPSKLHRKMPFNFSYGLQTDVNSLLNNEKIVMEGESGFGNSEITEYKINRPMKITAMAEATPFGDFCKFYGQFGIAIRNPAAKNKDSQNLQLFFLESTFISGTFDVYILKNTLWSWRTKTIISLCMTSVQ